MPSSKWTTGLVFVCLFLAVVVGINFFTAGELPSIETYVMSPKPQPVFAPTPVPSPRAKIIQDTPFVPQAPTGNWDDSRQQEGCEEAAAWMGVLWATGSEAPKSLAAQEAKIQEISDWEEKEYGSYHDTSAEDTVKRIYKGYFKYDKVEVVSDVTKDSIKQELMDGNLVQVPADGRVLKNPNYTAPGPERHNLVIVGYDDTTGEFITNDNGTRMGRGYRYKYDVVTRAIRDYPTGYHEPIRGVKKVMIVISK